MRAKLSLGQAHKGQFYLIGNCNNYHVTQNVSLGRVRVRVRVILVFELIIVAGTNWHRIK